MYVETLLKLINEGLASGQLLPDTTIMMMVKEDGDPDWRNPEPATAEIEDDRLIFKEIY